MFLKLDMQHGALVSRQGHKSHSDMRHVHFLNSTGDMGINKRQRHATLAFFLNRQATWAPPPRPRLRPHLRWVASYLDRRGPILQALGTGSCMKQELRGIAEEKMDKCTEV